jgi:hypothetical protein
LNDEEEEPRTDEHRVTLMTYRTRDRWMRTHLRKKGG